MSVAVLTLLVISPVFVDASLGKPLTCPLSTQAVVIDGKWTSKSEWNDTAETKLLVGAGSAEGFFRIKHDATWLYVLSESLVDKALEYDTTTGHGDWMQIYLDTLHDEGKSPKTDDYKMWAAWTNPSYMDILARKGTGTGWGDVFQLDGLQVKIGLDSGNSPHSPTPHVVAEWKIPLSIIGKTEFGLFVRGVSDSSEVETMHLYWPGPTQADQGVDPSSWGTVTLSSVPIPEFTSAWLIVVASVLAVMVISRKATRSQ